MTLFPLISLITTLTALASYVNYRFIRLPMTIGVMFVAMVASLALIVAGPFAGGSHSFAISVVGQIDFNRLLLHGLLALLLFAGSIQVKFDDLVREWKPIFLLAIFGTLLSTAIVGTLTWLILNWLGISLPLMHAMLFGALISPTDPIAVLAIMRSVGAPKQLEVQLSAESLFNDGIGVVIFLSLLELTTGDGSTQFTAGSAVLLLLKEVGGAIGLGLVSGFIVYRMLRRVDNYQVEVLLTLALSMGGYALADALHFSAPIAIVVAGVFIGNRGRTSGMSSKTEGHFDAFWELVDEILNAVLFLLIGLEMLILPWQWRWIAAGATMIPVVLLSRWISVASIITPIRRIAVQEKGAIAVLTWGGLRGGISVAMALSLPQNGSKNVLLTITYCVVVFSIVVQGLSIGRVIKKLCACDGAAVEEQLTVS